jgi:nucleoside-triphosphatase
MVPPGDDRWVIIDEIGKMECLSQLFRDTLLEVLDAPNGVLASIALQGDAFVESIKRRSDVHLLLVTKENRDALAGTALDGLWQENLGPMKRSD